MEIRFDNISLDKYLVKNYLKEIFQQINCRSSLEDFTQYIRNFERDFSHYLGKKYALLTDSGTSALQLALLASGIKKGDKVLLPAITHPACALAVISIGAEPVFVDIKENNLTIDEEQIELSLDKKVKAVISVHLYGLACNMERINKIAYKYNLKVIEDASHAVGGVYKNKKLGNFSDIAVFSFSYYKNLSSVHGKGGCLVTDSKDYVEEVKNVLKESKYSALKFSPISFMDLAVIYTKLKMIKLLENSKIKAKNLYQEKLKELKTIKLFFDNPEEESIRLFYVIISKERGRLFSYLRKKKVLCEDNYLPLYKLKFSKQFRGKSLAVSERYYKYALCLPMYSLIKDTEVDYVIRNIKLFFRK